MLTLPTSLIKNLLESLGAVKDPFFVQLAHMRQQHARKLAEIEHIYFQQHQPAPPPSPHSSSYLNSNNNDNSYHNHYYEEQPVIGTDS